MPTQTFQRRSALTACMAVTALVGSSFLAQPGAGTTPTPMSFSPTSVTTTAFTSGVTASTVFERGEQGYHTFRIPAVIEADGVLLAFAEARVDDPGDHGNIDMVLKTSTDGGATWGDFTVLADAGPDKWGNPVPIYDEQNDTLILNMTRTGGDVTGSDIFCGLADEEDMRRSFMLYSTDSSGGWLDWGGLTEITDDVRPNNWRHFVGGPGHGIQLEHGPHAGRLIIQGNHSIAPPAGSGINCQDPRLLGGHILYSDDDGDTWHLGAVDQPLSSGLHPSESTAVELDDGSVYVSSRDQHGDSPGRRVEATSSDGGETFDATFQAVSDVVTTFIQGSLIKLSGGSGGSELVFSATGHPTARENLTLWSSSDDGGTWQRGVQVYEGPAGYSDMVDLGGQPGNEAIGVLFENGERLYDEQFRPYNHRISFARVPVDLIDTLPPPLPVTPDTSSPQHDGMVSGDPRLVDGAFGSALDLAGDYVELPLDDQLAFDDEAFTAATWFRSTSQRPQALVWAHSRVPSKSKWWIRLEPNNGRIRALLDDSTSVRSLTSAGDYADGAWHHVALTRGPNGVTLYVDGSPVDSGSALSGSVSTDAYTGIRVGARVDGITDPLRGNADELWMFDRALTSGEISTLVQQNAGPSSDTVVHLPFEEVQCADAGAQSSPDLSGHGNDGDVTGCAASAAGVFDEAVELSYADHVEVPHDASLDVGDQPFTAAAWFRTSRETDQTILWAYNWGSSNPQWWVRLEPGHQRIRANLNDGTSVVSTQAPGTFNDGTWHHVALVRDSSGVTLYVDGSPADTAGPITGSLSAGAQHGIHVGQRVDGNNPISGLVDEVWLLDQALTSTEVTSLFQQNAAPGGATQLHLPLDELQGS